MNVEKQEGLQLRRLQHGGFLVCHPDIYEHGALFCATTTIDEAFEFMRGVLDRKAEPVTADNSGIREGKS